MPIMYQAPEGKIQKNNLAKKESYFRKFMKRKTCPEKEYEIVTFVAVLLQSFL